MEFEGVYRTYFKDVYYFARSLSADNTLAEEIAQETFFKAFQAIDRYDGKKDIRAWLFTIARNTYFNLCKKQKRVTPSDVIDELAATDFADIDDRLSNEESAFQIHRLLHTMQEPYKEVFTLRAFGELKYEQIGRLFGKSPGWARVTYYRAKTMIANYMEERKNDKDHL